MKGLIGKKVGMSQVFVEGGNMVPVTVIDITSLIVVGKRTPEKDKYSAIALGFGVAKENRLTAAQKGSFKKAGAPRRKESTICAGFTATGHLLTASLTRTPYVQPFMRRS